MKAFEKWWNKDGLGGICGKKSSEETWKAALKEVLKHTIKDTCSLMTELRNWIKQELNDEETPPTTP